MHLVGLTGGIGSGKSTVARRLASQGAHVVDADAVAREVVAAGEPAVAEIAARFGNEVVTPDGELDRAAVATIVFADPDSRAELEAIMHPRIGARIAERLAAHADAERREERPRLVVLDHPLLVETGQADTVAEVVVVTAPEELRVRRVVADRGMQPEEARARIRAQASDDRRGAAADHVIVNDGDLDHLHAQVDRVHAVLRAHADDTAAGLERRGE